MDERKRKIARFFAIMYLVFGIAIIYLLFFNLGISIEGKTAGGELEVLVKNNSLHLIRDINVFVVESTGSEKKVLSIQQLVPSEEKAVKLSEIHAVEGKIRLVARAPYHLEVSKEIQIQGQGTGTEDFRVELEAVNKIFAGSEASFKLTICNQFQDSKQVKIETVLDAEFFTTVPAARSIELKSSECTTQEFKITGSKAGEATVSFNISGEQFNKRVEKQVQIIE
ncbi:MAG: hypothetical protein J4478_04250 [Candidatus Diapherotrites archaeon]|uniref:Uncharacterized protein n=1 Tax=Candidatus Iainarchaeum sp. TaxID=3101447 RepID=A0A7J4K116_9ARCH|nr:hypothetical protein [Candidatus Diapherotrites archaeon]HIH21196.1 hypothetical protein [Candidatus Diapherotrites archaeon]HIH32654.1 hypothetical protein [Candidatus Diapherotrites archaeon]